MSDYSVRLTIDNKSTFSLNLLSETVIHGYWYNNDSPHQVVEPHSINKVTLADNFLAPGAEGKLHYKVYLNYAERPSLLNSNLVSELVDFQFYFIDPVTEVNSANVDIKIWENSFRIAGQYPLKINLYGQSGNADCPSSEWKSYIPNGGHPLCVKLELVNNQISYNDVLGYGDSCTKKVGNASFLSMYPEVSTSESTVLGPYTRFYTNETTDCLNMASKDDLRVYNCIAYSVGKSRGGFLGDSWLGTNDTGRVQDFYRANGFTLKDNCYDLERNMVAVYKDEKGYTHAAKYDGLHWTSKLGMNYLITHQDIYAVSRAYKAPVHCFTQSSTQEINMNKCTEFDLRENREILSQEDKMRLNSIYKTISQEDKEVFDDMMKVWYKDMGQKDYSYYSHFAYCKSVPTYNEVHDLIMSNFHINIRLLIHEAIIGDSVYAAYILPEILEEGGEGYEWRDNAMNYRLCMNINEETEYSIQAWLDHN